MLYPSEVYGRLLSRDQYDSGRPEMRPPDQLTDEFYHLKYVLPKGMQTGIHYALDALVSIEDVIEFSGFSRVSYEFAEVTAIRESQNLRIERDELVQDDGVVYIRDWARRGLFKTLQNVRREVGYFTSVDQDFQALLRNTQMIEPSRIAIVAEGSALPRIIE